MSPLLMKLSSDHMPETVFVVDCPVIESLGGVGQPCTNVMQGVQGISDIITIPGLVNVDFADVKSIMCNSGTAMLGVGVSTGKNRAEEAAMVSIAQQHDSQPTLFSLSYLAAASATGTLSGRHIIAAVNLLQRT